MIENHAFVVGWSRRSVDPQRIRVRIRTTQDFHSGEVVKAFCGTQVRIPTAQHQISIASGHRDFHILFPGNGLP